MRKRKKVLSWMTPWFLAHIRACVIHYDKKQWKRIGSGEETGKIITSVLDLLEGISKHFNW